MGAMAAQIGGSLVSGYFANKAAKKQANAMDRANEMSNMGYLDARPYVTAGYEGGQNALNNALATGAYTGPTYAGLNNTQTNALNNQTGFGNTAFGLGQGLANTGSAFGGNYANLFNQAQGGGAINNAINFANANSGSLVNAALRDSTRQLTQNTLPGINRAASASGNTNSSRAGVADAIALRDYSDRAADVSADVRNTLINQSLAQQQRDFGNAMSANQGLQSAFGTGIGTGFKGLGNALAAGTAFQKDDQNQLTDAKTNFDSQRDFEMDQYAKYMSGILGRAPTQGKNYTPNLVDPTAATISGAIGGFGMGGNLFNSFQNMGGMGGGGMPAGYNPYAAYTQSDYANPLVL